MSIVLYDENIIQENNTRFGFGKSILLSVNKNKRLNFKIKSHGVLRAVPLGEVSLNIDFPQNVKSVSWDRDSGYSIYPIGHIARNSGIAEKISTPRKYDNPDTDGISWEADMAAYPYYAKDDSKNLKYKTFMLEYAEAGLHTSVAFDWDQYFDVNMKEEVKYVMQNNLPMTMCDTDRVKKDKLKKTRAETIELYNFVAPETPSASAPYDSGMRDYIIERMDAGDSVICGIFHNIDTAGHTYGYAISTQYVGAVINCDMYAYSVLQAVKQREAKYNEEWLVIFGNDHGGIGQGHGEQSPEERNAWIASNIPFENN